MTDELTQRIASLPPEKRRLFERALRQKRAQADARAVIGRRDPDEPVPATVDQSTLWFYQMLKPEGTAYNIGNGCAVHGEIEAGPFRQALQKVAERQEVLRLFYRSVDGRPFIELYERVDLPLRFVDLRGVEGDRREEALDAVLRQTIKVPFDMARGPMWRLSLVHLEDSEHLAAFCFHHSITDSLSYDILFRELFTFYAACLEGTASPIPPLPVTFTDYAVWRNAWMASEEYRRQERYWLEQLRGAPTVLELPTDLPRPAEPTFSGRRQYFDLPESLGRRVRECGADHAATSLMVLLTGLFGFLHRYSGMDDMLVGTTASIRDGEETENLIGCFLNRLAIRARVRRETTFGELLAEVKATVREGLAHRQFPFVHLVRALAPRREANRMPLFQISYVFVSSTGRNVHKSSLEIDASALKSEGFSVESWTADRQIAETDLQFTFMDAAGSLGFFIEYATDLFFPSTIERMGSLFLGLVDAMLRQPSRAVSRLPWAFDGATSPRGATPLPALPSRTLHEIFENQVDRTPHHRAVAGAERSFTYEELDRPANALAHRLRQLGVGPEVVVGAVQERSAAQVKTLLAIFKAGGVALPVAPTLPAARKRGLLEDSEARVVVAGADALEGVDLPPGAVLVDLDAEEERIAGLPTTRLPGRVDARHLASIYYTSGSTGVPKGVASAHRGYFPMIDDLVRALGVGEGDQVLQFSPPSADGSLVEMLLAFRAGATLHPAPREVVADLDRFLAFLEDRAISVAHFVPSYLAALPVERLGSVRILVTVGEVPDPARVRQHLPAVRYANLFGVTEASALSTLHLVTEVDDRPIPIGRTLAGFSAHVVDPGGSPLPPGVAGELMIGGESLARAYLGRPGLTALRFFPDPFAASRGSRLYRTGDRVRRRSDGELEFLGRLDRQVKMRGQRLELGEVEAVLRAHPDVDLAAVLLREDRPGYPRLVAYVQTASRHESRDGLRAHLRASLPDYMIPSIFVPVDAFPLTGSGKIDYKALPAPAETRGTAIPPRRSLELDLQRLWAEVLGSERPGIHDSFFERGGDSLLAIQLTSAMRRELGVSFDLPTFFSRPTIAAQADWIEESGKATSTPLVLLRRGAPERPPLFLIHPAIGLVFSFVALADRLRGDRAVYALQSVGFDKATEPLETIESMAEAYLAAVETVQPEGPVALAGWSLGARIAYEMARRLEEAGREVGFVGLIDAATWSRLGQESSAEEMAEKMAAGVFGDPDADGQKGRLALETGLPEDDLARIAGVAAANLRALGRYRPRPSRLRVTLFVSEEVAAESPADAALGWGAVARGGVEVVSLGGDHHGLLDPPHVGDLAAAIDRALSANALGVGGPAS